MVCFDINQNKFKDWQVGLIYCILALKMRWEYFIATEQQKDLFSLLSAHIA